MKKALISILFCLLLIAGTTSAYNDTTQDVVNGGESHSVEEATASSIVAEEAKPQIIAEPPVPVYSDTLREGQTKVYYWNGEKYEVTLVWVADVQYWEDGNGEDGNDYEKTATVDSAKPLDNRPSAKFSINGQITNTLHPGEKGVVTCGSITVNEIGNSITKNNDQGSVSYVFYPRSCEPQHNDYLTLYEHQVKTVRVEDHSFRVGLQNISGDIAVITVGSQAGKVHEGSKIVINGLSFFVKKVHQLDNLEHDVYSPDNDQYYDSPNRSAPGGYVILTELSVVDQPSEPVKERLLEGETQTYYWNGQSYELTLLFVSNPIYWEGNANQNAESTNSISNHPSAKFMLNGEVSNNIPVGERDNLACGTIAVARIETTDQYKSIGRDISDQGTAGTDKDSYVDPPVPVTKKSIAYFTLYPKSCSNEPQPCTSETKLCPDGSAVGRTGPDCAFAPCPYTEQNQRDCEDQGGQWRCTQNGDGCDCYLVNPPFPDDSDGVSSSDNPDGMSDTSEGMQDTVKTDGNVCLNGCVADNRCLPYGTRLANGEEKYCSVKGVFALQLEDGTSCQNNYECVSNQCLNGECKSLDKQIEENTSLLKRIIDWFGGLF